MSYLIKLNKIIKPTPIKKLKLNPETEIKNETKTNSSPIQIFFDKLPNIDQREKLKKKSDNLTNFLKEFSKEENINYSILENLSKKEIKKLENLLDFVYKKRENYQNYFILRKIFKKFHKEILYRNYHKKNLFYVRKLFTSINKRIFKKYILDKGGSNFQNIDLSNFLNFFFNKPNDKLKNILKYELKEFRRNTSIIVFSFEKYRKEFFKNLYFLNKMKWENFEDMNFNFLTKKKILFSQCILDDSCIKYFESLFLLRNK